MRRISVLPAVLLAMAACTPAAEPATTPAAAAAEDRQPVRLEPPPVHSLIGHREAIGLSSEQIVALDSIGQHLHAENQPLMRKMTELRSQHRTRSGRDLRANDPLLASEEGRAMVEEIRRNNRQAVEAVGELLTAEQQERTCELFRAGDRRRPQRAAGRQPGGAVEPRGAAAVWNWCATPETEAGPSTASG